MLVHGLGRHGVHYGRREWRQVHEVATLCLHAECARRQVIVLCPLSPLRQTILDPNPPTHARTHARTRLSPGDFKSCRLTRLNKDNMKTKAVIVNYNIPRLLNNHVHPIMQDSFSPSPKVP